MRPVLAATFALLLVVSALPAEAKLLPKTEKATREFVHDVLVDTDESGAKMLRTAKKMVRALQDEADKLPPVPGLPPAPEPPTTEQGELEIRLTLTQPGVKGQDMTLGAMWIGSSRAYWTGVYWAEGGDAGEIVPNVMDVNEGGLVLFVDGGSLATGNAINVTYHFLGLNGVHVVHKLGEIPILAQMPAVDRIDVGAAAASDRAEGIDYLFLTPWNLYDHNVTAGITILNGDEILHDETITACGDYTAEVMEPGCRLLYAMPFADEATTLQLWSLDENGERVIEREIARDALLLGVTFAA